jgi:catechol 2,3-dioxygenase-like lactoylglutathione lyase family enzyme
MSSSDARSNTSLGMPEAGTSDMKLEVVTLPVSGVDRAKRFYQSLGWRLDADISVGDAFRVVQLTPPHSACSIEFGKGLTTAEPGSAQRLLLAVYGINMARTDLLSRAPRSARCSTWLGACPGPGPTRSLLPDLCLVQRPRWQRVAAPGDQNAASGPGMGRPETVLCLTLGPRADPGARARSGVLAVCCLPWPGGGTAP